MVGSKHVRLRVGVIGLGRLWETRHKPSLARLEDRFRITAIYDQVYRRAEIEAAQLDCAACEGLSALVERPDVDVIYLLSRQWFGLHPDRTGLRGGQTGLLRVPLADDLPELESLAKRIEQSGIAFMPEFARRCYPATLRLKELLATQLGPPRLIVGHSRLFGFDRYAMPGPTTQIAPAPLLIDPGSFLSTGVVSCCSRCRPRFTACGAWSPLRGGAVPSPTSRVSWPPFPAGDGPYLVWPLLPDALGRGHPLLASAGFPGLRRTRSGLAGDARANPVVGLERRS